MDYTKFNSFINTIYSLLEEQYEKLKNAHSNFRYSGSFTQGLEEFRKERKATIELLSEYIGYEEAKGFSALHSNILKQHPSLIDINYSFREFGEQEIKNHIFFIKVLMAGLKDGSIKPHGNKIKRRCAIVLKELYSSQQKQRPYESMEDLRIATGIDSFELYDILEYFKDKDLVREENLSFRLL